MPAVCMSFVGIASVLLFCFLWSQDRRRIRWSLTVWGLALQYVLAILLLKTYPAEIFAVAQRFFSLIYEFAGVGAKFLFGSLTENKDFVILHMAAVIIFVSSVMAVLNYLRALPAIIYGLALVMQRTMRTSGAETLAATMFIFMGIEAVTALKTVLGKMTRSELFTVMTCFMATIAGSVMAVYVNVFGANPGYILAASLMHAPAALALSKMMVPETEEPETGGRIQWNMLLPPETGVVEAAANGAVDGLKLTATIAAILLAFVSIIHILNSILGLFGSSFDSLGGYAFAPVAFLIGIPWDDCVRAGNLLAIKVFFNEWLAYAKMKEMMDAGLLGPRAAMMLTYALASFANFGSLAILIGGISAIAPERKKDVIDLGLKALLTGFLAGLLTAAVAGTLSWE